MFQASAALSIGSCVAFMAAGFMIIQAIKRQIDIENVLFVLLLCGAYALLISAVCGLFGFIGV